MFRQLFRTPVIRRSAVLARPAQQQAQLRIPTFNRFTAIRNYSDHHEETYEEFTTRFEKEFDEAYDLFEVQRVLNNAFSYDLVPAPSVIEKALLACRRVNDYATAVRVFEGLKVKVENNEQYEAYLDELKDIRKDLGVDLKEELFPEAA